MKARTFRHGIHPADGKSLSASSPIRLFVPTGAGEAVYPLSQHIGTPAVPVVSVGDRVRAGQKLAEDVNSQYAKATFPMVKLTKEQYVYLQLFSVFLISSLRLHLFYS